MANTALLPVSSVECHISLLPKAVSGIFFQLQAKAVLFMCFKCWAPRLGINIAQSFEGGEEELRLPSEIPCPPKIPLIRKNKSQRQRQKELGAHSWALTAMPVQWMEFWQAVISLCLDSHGGKGLGEAIQLTQKW